MHESKGSYLQVRIPVWIRWSLYKETIVILNLVQSEYFALDLQQ